MTRMPWTYSRSGGKGDDKTNTGVPQHWFSRTSGEPSRQALTNLVKEHKRGQSGSTSSSQGSRSSNTRSTGSRGKTVVSMNWDYDRTRPMTIAESASSPPSPTPTREGSIVSAIERPESAARSLISKGSQILRNKSSKMALHSFGSTSVLGLSIPLRTSSALGHTSSVTTSPLRGEDLRKAISPPFAFQHVTHTEQTQFPALKGIEQSELAYKFSDMAYHQAAVSELKGIKVTDLPRSSTSITTESQSEDEDFHRLPRTPPRPSPPPKDGPAALLPPLKLSPRGSFEHFFDSSPSSPVSSTRPDFETPDSDLYGLNLFEAPEMEHAAANSLDSKPLPQIPGVIHAVSTSDDSARPMKSTPLPTLPGNQSNATSRSSSRQRYSHRYQRSSSTLRHMSTFPAPRQAWDSDTSDESTLGDKKTITRHRSDLALFQQASLRRQSKERPISVGLKAIDTLNWEDAVDEAWDDSVDEIQFVHEVRNGTAASASPSSSFNPYNNHLSLSEDELSSIVPPTVTATMADTQDHELSDCEDALLGLGIHSPTTGGGQNDHRTRSFLQQPKDGALSKSSSQESIILSIASSILGTYRSSNSSVHSEAGHPPCQEESAQDSAFDISPFIIQSSPFTGYDRRTAARPESGCLPAILNSPSLADDETCDESPEDTVPPLPVQKRTASRHRHAASAPKFEVPERRSSVIFSPANTSQRQRANTDGSSNRMSPQISYSLFPAPPAHQRVITKS